MEISSSLNATFASRAQAHHPQEQTRATGAQPAGEKGPDKESDGDSDDRAVTSTRGQNVNIKA